MRSIKVLVAAFVFCASATVSSLFMVRTEAAVIFAQAQTQSRQLQRQADSVHTWPSKAKRWALIIGVDQYRDGQINALKGSVNDAHTLADVLVRNAGFPQDQVIVLTTDQPDERQPTRINILTYLSNLASLVPKDGLLLLSFAGHGIERGGQAYLIPSDARLSHDVSLLEESAVSVTRMHDRIKAIGVGQVIVLLDACRNDPGGRADAPNNMSAAYTKFNFDVRNREVQAFATFYATAVGYRAYEYTEKHQGYFTWAIVEGLKGGAANEKGEVTLAALVKYVQDNVPKRIAIDLGKTEQQKPFATIEGYRADELVLSLATPNRVEVPTSVTNDDQVGSQTQVSVSQPTPVTITKKRGAKSGNVAIVFVMLKGGGSDATVNQATSDEFIGPFAAALSKSSLSVTGLSENPRDIAKTINNLRSRSSIYALIIKTTLSLSELAPYNGLDVCEANGSLELIDSDSGKVIARENVSRVRGFGNSLDQARRNALKNAADGVSESFVKQVVVNAN